MCTKILCKSTLFFMLDQNQLMVDKIYLTFYCYTQSLDRASLNSDSEMISRIKKDIATKEEFLKRPVPPITTDQRRMSTDVLPSPPGMSNGKTLMGMGVVEQGGVGSDHNCITRSNHIMYNEVL